VTLPIDRDRHATLVRAQSRRNLPDDLAGYRRARMAERRRARWWRGPVARWGVVIVGAGVCGWLAAWVR